LVDDVGHCYPSSGNKPAKSENYELACDASSSRRLVIRGNLALAVNHPMLDFGKYRALALTSRISATS